MIDRERSSDSVMSKKHYNYNGRALAGKIPAWGYLAPILAVALFFLAVRLNTPTAGKVTALLCVVAALGYLMVLFNKLAKK